jgi:nucleotide-binding universal stress UspA family protein
MKKIMVPVDFSDYSFSSVSSALLIANQLPAEIRLLHVFDDPFVDHDLDQDLVQNSVSAYTQNLIHKMEKDARDNMSALVEEVNRFQQEQQLNVPVSTEIRRGFAVDQIVLASKEWMAQLIMMGSRGHSRLEKVVFGTVTKGVINEAHCAVLALPPKYVWKEPREVLYATNFLEYDEIAISRLLNLLQAYHVKLHVTHFSASNHVDDELKLHELEEKLRMDHRGGTLEYEVVDSKALLESMHTYVAQKNIDIIALTTRKMSGLQRIFTKSATVNLLYHADKPLLVFHEK